MSRYVTHSDVGQRSESICHESSIQTPTPDNQTTPARWASLGITVLKKIAEKKDDALRREILEISRSRYGQDAKTLQIDAVVNLVRGRNTFLLAGTGYGKSRIPELYFRTLPISEKPVIIVLNPSTRLETTKVLEKKAAKFTAINLTTNCGTWSTSVIGSSSDWVWSCLDKAHMVYKWGIVGKDSWEETIIQLWGDTRIEESSGRGHSSNQEKPEALRSHIMDAQRRTHTAWHSLYPGDNGVFVEIVPRIY
ncbi:hypothetical protein PGT21_000804 [Puccinia graminis f. sp. tritici]|uniref:ATP-dependent DNA helicase sgs1 n=1 Tax=Puccinia graminis f. sp. tritici TaxID=56615 RepID=A0A5B0LIH8_PUCGR|nr:hypothetical protein PGT21_000804 [Puccinia graminis f. sp. tritici]